MKILKRKRLGTDPTPNLKAKRVDLNEGQLALQRLVENLPVEELVYLEGEIHKILPPGALETRLRRKGLRFYSPKEVASATGLSLKTVYKYVDGFLRVVRREGETQEDFRKRAVLADRSDAPLLQRLSDFEREGLPAGEIRLISSRVLIFLILAPTGVRGEKPLLENLRKILSESSILDSGRPTPIHRNSNVTTWEIPSE